MNALHVTAGPGVDLAMVGAVAVAMSGAGVLLGLGLAALLRRRSWSYLLVAGALAALFARASVAALSVAGMFGPFEHHLVEHSLDAVMVALVVAAVYHARSVRREAGDPTGARGDRQ
jgi:hypothetical protein